MFECHITIEPVAEKHLKLVESIAERYRFKPAKLLMQNRETDTPERSMYDTFLTGHSKDFADLSVRMSELCRSLRGDGFHVWRYKIEAIIVDSRNCDLYCQLSTTSFPPAKAPQ